MIYHQLVVLYRDLVVELHNIILRTDCFDIIVYFFTVLTALDIQLSLIIRADIKRLVSGNFFVMSHEFDLIIHIGYNRSILRSCLGIDLQCRVIINILSQFHITVHVLVRNLIAYCAECALVSRCHCIIISSDQGIDIAFLIRYQRNLLCSGLGLRLACRQSALSFRLLLCFLMTAVHA